MDPLIIFLVPDATVEPNSQFAVLATPIADANASRYGAQCPILQGYAVGRWGSTFSRMDAEICQSHGRHLHMMDGMWFVLLQPLISERMLLDEKEMCDLALRAGGCCDHFLFNMDFLHVCSWLNWQHLIGRVGFFMLMSSLELLHWWVLSFLYGLPTWSLCCWWWGHLL